MIQKWVVACALIAGLLMQGRPADADVIAKKLNASTFSSLEVRQSARAMGMGGAFTSVADDVNAVWWNPAGLNNMKGLEATFTYSQWFVDTNFNAGAIAGGHGPHAFAVNFMSFNVGDIAERTILQPQGTGRILDVGAVAVGAAYAYRFTDKMSFGLRVHWARENMDLVDYSTVNVDFGTMFHTGFQNLRLAMTMRNFGRDTKIEVEDFEQPLNFNLAAAAEVYGKKKDSFYVTGAFEMSFSINYEERYHLGGEAWLGNLLALRAGYMFNYDVFGFTAGGGVRVPVVGRDISVDFAWQESRVELKAPIRIAVTFGL